jgi:pimeloyl-ACP methyl ester carboxylesterase
MEKAGNTSLILQWSKRIRWTLMLAVLAYLLACTYMWATQRQHVFKPNPKLETTPDRLGMKFEEIRIPSGSGADRGLLDAWWISAGSSDAPTVLYLHGNDKNIGGASDIDRVARLHSMGYNLFAVDYRGYGKSTGGAPTEAKAYEDAEASWDYLIRQRACDPKRTFIFGHSLGSAIAIDLAVHHPEAAGLIVENAFTSMVDMSELEYPFLPAELLLNQRFDSLSKIGNLKIPLLLIHGTWDKLVPYQMSQQLFKRAPQPKLLKLIEGGGHSNDAIIAPLEFRDAVTQFIQRYAMQH